MFGDFRAGHSGKESKDHDLGAARVDRLEPRQRGLERPEIFDRDRPGCAGLEEIVERHRLSAAAPLLALLMTAVIDQQPAHRLSAKREPLRPAVPLNAPFVLQAQPGLMYQRVGWSVWLRRSRPR